MPVASMFRALPLAILSLSFGGVGLTVRSAGAEEPPAAVPAPPTTQPSATPSAPASAPDGIRAPTGEDLEEARRHFDVALECYSRGRYRDAILELEAARELDPAGKDLVYNLALVHEKLGELQEALAYLRRYLEMETDPDERARTEASITRLEGALRQESEAEPAPEPRTGLTATSPREAPPPGRLDAWVWGSAGVAACALLVGAVLGVRALALNPGAEDATGGSRSADDFRHDAHAARRSAVGADVAFGVAALSGAAATLLYFGRTPVAASDAMARPNPGSLESASPTLGLDLNFVF